MSIRCVIIGCAHMHVNELAQYIYEQPDSELCGIADIPADLPERTEKRYTRAWNIKNIISRFGVLEFNDYREMLDDIKPDVAYIICENSKKAEAAEEAARRGIDIIIEKPMASDYESALKIVALKDKYNVNVFVNWPVIWRKYIREMKTALDSGSCGTLIKLRYLNGHTGPLGKGARHRGVSADAEDMTDNERARIWWYRDECGGGAYLDILSYGCYYTRWMFGKIPIDIMSIGDNLNTPFGNVEDNVSALMRFENGHAVAEGTWTTPRSRIPSGPEAICTDGVIWCGGAADSGAFVSAVNILGEKLSVPELSDDPVYLNIAEHYAAFKKYDHPMHETLTAEFNADVSAMIDAAKRSNQSNRAEPVSF